MKRKAHLTDLDDNSFQDMIKDLASDYLQGINEINIQKLRDILPSFPEDNNIIEELRTGGILKGSGNRFKVNERLLIHGFGLLLVDQLIKAAQICERDLDELISEWLEPQADMDIKASICEVATLHSFTLSNLPKKVRVSLLLAWTNSHNPGSGIEENLCAYFPVDPKSYFDLAEIIWSDNCDNLWAQENFMGALLR